MTRNKVAISVVVLSVICGIVWAFLPDPVLEFQSQLLDESDNTAGMEDTDRVHATDTAFVSPDHGNDVLEPPVALMANGQPIDIGKLSRIAHAGPAIADIDGDGDRDLLVGDFPGYFWHFDNVGTDQTPVYTSVGQLQAGGIAAKTPVY